MTRFLDLAHGFLLSLVLVLPLMRLAWDQWAQTAVHLIWAFFIVLGSILLLLGRSGDFSRFESALRRMGPLGATFLGAGLLSTVFSPFPHSAIPAYLNDFPVLAFILLGAGASDKRRVLYSRAIVGAGLLSVLAAFLFSGSGTNPWTGPLLNPNLLAALVILVAPQAVELGRGAARILWWPAAGLLGLGLFLSHSMAAYAAVLIQIGLAAALIWLRKANKPKKYFLGLAGIALLVGSGIFLTRAEWPKLFHGDPDRWTWGLTSLRAFAAHPILGVGPGAFGEAYPAYRASPWGLNSLYAHNFVLEFLAERGLVGAGALFLLMGTLIVRAGRNAVKGNNVALFLGVLGFCFYNLFHIGFSFPALYWLFFLAASLGACEERASAPPVNDSPCNHARSINGATPKILIMILWVLVGAASFALFRADQCLAQARVALSEDRWDRARAQVEIGLFWNRWSPGLYELRAAMRMKSQNWDGAKSDLDRAVALAPASAVFRIESAELAVERGEADHALRDYEISTRLMPLKAGSWERWGDLLFDRGRKEDAERAYAGALRALADPRVLGGDAARRESATKRVEEKRQRLAHVTQN